MSTKTVSSGTVHTVPEDLKNTLTKSKASLEAWQSLTPLGRNEWICWTISVKKEETRKDHIKRLVAELKEGKRRPCCWIGCIHRNDKKLSPSVRGILEKQSKKRPKR